MKKIPILNISNYLEIKEEPVKKAPSLSVNTSKNINDLDLMNRDLEENFNILFQVIEKKNGEYGTNAREPFIQKLASLCNSFGVSEKVCIKYTLNMIKNHPASLRKDKPISEKYIISPIKDTYKRYEKDFGTWKQYASKLDLTQTPFIPAIVYKNIPTILKMYVNMFKVQREKDISLIGAITALSGCFPHNIGLYSNDEVSPSLFSFIIAPPASGKGQLTKVLKITSRIAYEFEDEWEEALANRARAEESGESFEMPYRKMLYIPANTSKSALITQLERNGGYGIIFESEADTLGVMMDKDWANFSDSLRKAFQHETISYLRKTNNEHVVIENPRLSILLSGTKGQLYKLIPDVENGLMSRFIFYIYGSEPKWNTGIQSTDFKNYELVYKDIRSTVFDIYNEMRANSFILSDNQWEDFHAHFEPLLGDVHKKYGESAVSLLVRMGLIAYRIMLLFSILELGNKKDKSKETLTCSDKSFTAAIELSKVLIEHALYVHSILSKSGYRKLSNIPQILYKSLPDKFSRGEFDGIADKLNIKQKTAEKYINDMIKKKLIKRVKHGAYEKVI